MKPNKILGFGISCVLGLAATSCSDFLEKTPMSQIPPEQYYSSASQIDAILMDNYPNILPGHGSWYGYFEGDDGTDNQVRTGGCWSQYTTDLWRSNNEAGEWYFSRIYYLNFAFSNILTRYGEKLDGQDNTISGDLPLVQHYIGELYFLRAYHYFTKLKTFCDFPIILNPFTTIGRSFPTLPQGSPATKWHARFSMTSTRPSTLCNSQISTQHASTETRHCCLNPV